MDQLQAMRVFVRVVETRNFTRVAQEFNSQQSAVSKWIAGLENHLGVRLLNRNTRRIELTPAAEDYYQRCLVIIAAVDEAATQVRQGVITPKGNIHISAPVVLGRLHVLPVIADFNKRYPDVAVNITLTDRQVDLIAEGIDLAIRIGTLRDSTLIAKRLASYERIVVASPEYISRHESIERPEDLSRHNCLLHALIADNRHWKFIKNNRQIVVDVGGTIKSNNGDVLVQIIAAGAGISLLPRWMIYKEIERGDLQQLLADCQIENNSIYAVYPQRQHLPLPVRYLLDDLQNAFSSQSFFKND